MSEEIIDDLPKCPFCGEYNNDLAAELEDQEQTVVECICGKEYEVSLSVSYTYTSRDVKP